VHTQWSFQARFPAHRVFVVHIMVAEPGVKLLPSKKSVHGQFWHRTYSAFEIPQC